MHSPFRSQQPKAFLHLPGPPPRFKPVVSKKIKTDKPYRLGGGMQLRDGKDASGRKPKAQWAVTLAGILGGGALLVYSTSALAQYNLSRLFM